MRFTRDVALPTIPLYIRKKLRLIDRNSTIPDDTCRFLHTAGYTFSWG